KDLRTRGSPFGMDPGLRRGSERVGRGSAGASFSIAVPAKAGTHPEMPPQPPNVQFVTPGLDPGVQKSLPQTRKPWLGGQLGTPHCRKHPTKKAAPRDRLHRF